MKAIEIDLEALVKYNLTPNQYVFLFLTHSHQYAAMYKFVQEGPGFSTEEIHDLVERGFILNFNQSGYYYMDSFVLTDEVGDELFDQSPERAAREFWNTYPVHLFDRDRNEYFSLLATNKDQFIQDYYLRVGHSSKKHQRVMEALRYAIDNRMIDMSIRQWLDSEQWEAILDLKELQQATLN